MLLCNVAEFIQANFTSYIVMVPGGTRILSMANYFLNKHLYCEAFKLQTWNIIYVWHFRTDKIPESYKECIKHVFIDDKTYINMDRFACLTAGTEVKANQIMSTHCLNSNKKNSREECWCKQPYSQISRDSSFESKHLLL